MIKKIHLILFLLLSSFSVFSQEPTVVWDKTFGGINSDIPTSIIINSSGNFMLLGTSSSAISSDKSENSRGGDDYWLLEIDSNGQVLWEKTYGGSGSDIAKALIETSDGGFAIGGISTSPISDEKTEINKIGYDYWMIKISATGQKIWDRTIGSTGDDYLTSIVETSDGGFIMAGYTWGSRIYDKSENSRGGRDWWIVKLNSLGVKIWDKSIGGQAHDEAPVIFESSDGGLVLIGESSSSILYEKSQNSKGGSDYWIVKLNSNGQKVWDRTIGGNWHDEFTSAIKTSDGGYVLAGQSNSSMSQDKTESPRGRGDFWIVKVDANGHKIWDKTLGGDAYEYSPALTEDLDGNILVFGNSLSNISGDKTAISNGTYDWWLIKLTSSGEFISDYTFGGEDIDKVSSIVSTSTGETFLFGSSNSPASGNKNSENKGDYDYWLVKLIDGVASSTLPIIYYSESVEAVEKGTPLKVHFKAKTKN